jgi:hypothetical protein
MKKANYLIAGEQREAELSIASMDHPRAPDSNFNIDFNSNL